MKVALYARTAGDDVEHPLAGLAAYAARRGWTIAAEHTDPSPWHEGPREGHRCLLVAVRARSIQGILVPSLGHLARSLRHLTGLGNLLAAQGVALIAVDDHLDTTDPAGAIRWRDWLDLSARLDRQLRAEAAKLARLRTPGATWGRPSATVNAEELLDWWEGRRGRHPLTLREIARKLGVSEATARKHLKALRQAGRVNDPARLRALAARGGHRRGGKPPKPLDDAVLAEAWDLHLQAARLRGRRKPSLATIAHHLHISRRRLRTRLHELGLLPQSPGSAG